MLDFLFRRPPSGRPRRPPARQQAYWVADCAHCGIRSILGKVNPEEEAFETPDPEESFPIICIHCRHSNHFSAAQVRKVSVRIHAMQQEPTKSPRTSS